MMTLTGFADEAADSIEGQIEATRRLGWNSIEVRGIGGTNIHDIPEKEFDRVRGALEDAGIRADALGSNIANWGRDIGEPFADVLKTVDSTIARMKVLGGSLVRIMSWKVLRRPDGRAEAGQNEAERIRRLREITARFLGEGITPVHENCATWGGMSWRHTLRMAEEVPGLKLVFDTGNPPLTEDFSAPWPYPMQSSREFYEQVKEHIAHVHIKDSRFLTANREEEYCWPGEGEGDVEFVLNDLRNRGYSGYLSIEPHMAVVYHDTSVKAPEEIRMANYAEYGQRLERMLDALGIERN